jgi:hypothetical protein
VTGDLTDKDIEAKKEDGSMGQNAIYTTNEPVYDDFAIADQTATSVATANLDLQAEQGGVVSHPQGMFHDPIEQLWRRARCIDCVY